MTATQFTCAACHETFERDPEWTQEQQEQEYAENFGIEDELDVVCDDCYDKICGWAKREGLVP
jgi:hypothetical protein